VRLASLDLGTNALLLTIVDWDGISINPVFEDATLIRLGQDLQKRGDLHPDAKSRCLDALKTCNDIFKQYQVKKVIAVATEALRRASDGSDFLQTIKNRTGITFTIISDLREAKITFKATQKEFSYLKRNLLMIDIGGGSTEIVSGDEKNLFFSRSLKLGTVSLSEQFIQHDPIHESEIDAADYFIRKVINTISVDLSNPAAIGIAGTITTLKAILLKMDTYLSTIIHKSLLTKLEVDRLLDMFLSKTLAERLLLKGLPEKRADIIPMGALITQVVMDLFKLPEIYVSDRGLRWGVLYDWIEKEGRK